ncbi:hypothetical protein K503DRAFT_419444 [Rhizopogon vinicolor AM-OR11-026]|uniref:Uncharacterized protein n=1 Tax=Rhizopogon vinicolor AM-OR11-026 TaxID=1314800 RepID=A0A1B7MQ92_9AGAM|nr:hypothetical protein K503DRAFT_419444 [Rhizopogon vinicolor AM-OR11-026]
MKPVQFACLVIAATVGTANPLAPGCIIITPASQCSAECKLTSAEANCASNPHYPVPFHKSKDCYTCCGCLLPPEY